MDEIEGTVRRWGSSFAIVIPKDVVNTEKIKEGDKLHLIIDKHADLSNIFGTLKTKVSGQKFKDMCREGWD